MTHSPVLNLCFHGIGRPGRALEPGEDRYWIDSEDFLGILDLVSQRPQVRLSFDDGNASDIDDGLPALLDRGLVATFFVLAGRIDRPGSLSSADLVALHQSGMTIGTHGMHHRPWPGMSAKERQAELVDARARLADVVGTSVDQAACPLGQYDRRLLRELSRLNYSAVFTSDRRWAHSGRWLQPRFSVVRTDTPHSIERNALTQPAPCRRALLQAKGLLKTLR